MRRQIRLKTLCSREYRSTAIAQLNIPIAEATEHPIEATALVIVAMMPAKMSNQPATERSE
jgi:hypothetical protein